MNKLFVFHVKNTFNISYTYQLHYQHLCFIYLVSVLMQVHFSTQSTHSLDLIEDVGR